MAATITTEQANAILTGLANIGGNLESIMDRLAKLESNKAEPKVVSEPTVPSVAVVTDNGTVKMHSEPTLSDLKAYAKSKGQNIMGRITERRVAEWRALWDADHTEAVAKVEVRAQVTQAPNAWAQYTSKPQSADSPRQAWNRPSAKDAADMLVRHPERATAEAMPNTSDNGPSWDAIKSMTGRNGKPNPANLSGNDRRVAYKLMTGERTPSLMLVGAEICAKLRAANLI